MVIVHDTYYCCHFPRVHEVIFALKLNHLVTTDFLYHIIGDLGYWCTATGSLFLARIKTSLEEGRIWCYKICA